MPWKKLALTKQKNVYKFGLYIASIGAMLFTCSLPGDPFKGIAG
jgi:bacteriorhodopsin